MVGDLQAHDAIWQLSLTLRYEPDERIEQAGAGSQCCYEPDSLDALNSFLAHAPPTALTGERPAAEVALSYGAI